MAMVGTESVTLISHRNKPIANAAQEPPEVIHPGDHSNKQISVINASSGKTQTDVSFQKGVLEKAPDSQLYFFITKPGLSVTGPKMNETSMAFLTVCQEV